jgi:glycosylphosphatidylinositol transamidase
VNDKLEEFFKASGLKVARQRYEYKSAGESYAGENIYAILHAPRGDATEAIVLVGAWRNMEGVLNRSGVALVLTLARYFKRMHLFLSQSEALMESRLVPMVQRHNLRCNTG